MLRSLYTGISGLRSHQTMMDVTGNNIANVNTTGYKSANTVFADTLSQTLAAAGAPDNTQGGTNPAQVGLGVRVAGITTNFSQGATQVTGRNKDMLIDGDGFFVVQNSGINQYTRAGAFDLDATGTLVSLSGGRVQGWSANAAGVVDATGEPGPVSIPIGQLLDPEVSTEVRFAGALDSTARLATPASAGPPAVAANPGDTFTRPYGVYDPTGVRSNLAVKFEPTTVTDGLVSEWTLTVTHEGLPTPVTAKLGLDYSTTPPTKTLTGTTPGADPLRFTVADIAGNGGTSFDVEVDLNDLQVQNFAGDATSTAFVKSADGAPASTLDSWQVAPDGTINGAFSDGRTRALGRIAVANFDNPAGLSKEGGSVYSATTNSGVAQVGTGGEAGRGSLVTGALEMSNVDLAQEFTNLIVSQRGFQANSRVITSSDEMLQELVNLKR